MTKYNRLKWTKRLLFISLFITTSNLFAQDNSKFISQTVPDEVSPGQQFQVTITFENTGSTTWTRSNLIRLGTVNKTEEWMTDGTNRIQLPHDVAPGEQITFTANLTAISDGNALQWQMVHDGVAWFGERSEIRPITITRDPALDSLIVESKPFSVSSHVVGTYLFHWFSAHAGQVSGPWIPLEGREEWTGEVDYWKRMIKQIMAANIDVLYITLMPIEEQQRINLFQALYQLRQEGWEVPKVCAFFDTRVTYTVLGYRGNTGTEEGKDEFVHHYIRFYQQYFSQNPDDKADSYIYTQDGRPVLDVYRIDLDVDNIDQLTRDDVTNRLCAEFGAKHPIFNNSIIMIANHSYETFSFVDEKVFHFEAPNSYYHRSWKGNIRTAIVKPGFWNQNIRSPGIFLPRNGGSNYIDAWNSLETDGDVLRVFVETFNEYDEGSGIFAARTDTIYRTSSNTNTDTWSSTNDPYEYIKTTAERAAKFNDIDKLDAKILWHNIPDNMTAGETFIAKVVVRNEGDESWSAANNFKFGQYDTDSASFGTRRYLIDDSKDEIPTYGGIFKGRTKTFDVEIVAPNKVGSYETHWSMLQEGIAWFGETIAKNIEVTEASSVYETDLEKMFTVYPNPIQVNGIIHIKGTFNINDRVVLYTASGEKVYEKQFYTPHTEFSINTGTYGLKGGAYVMNFTKEGHTFTKKIIIRY